MKELPKKFGLLQVHPSNIFPEGAGLVESKEYWRMRDAINDLIECVAELQAHATNLKGGWTDAEIKVAALPTWPQIGDIVYRFNSQGQVIECRWTDSVKQRNCRDFLGIYKSKAEAEGAKGLVSENLYL